MSAIEMIKQYLDNNPEVKFIIKKSDDDKIFPLPRGKYEIWLVKDKEDAVKFNVNGDSIFDQFDENIAALLDTAKIGF